ncbi:Synaptotagmin-4 [Chamberlinius hualienensis]
MLYPSDTGMYTPGVVNEVTIPTLIGICLGGTVFLATIAAITCVCYRKRNLYSQDRLATAIRRGGNGDSKNVTHKRSSHVKSPGGLPPGPTLKKNTSPSGSKSPPSVKSPPEIPDGGGPSPNFGNGSNCEQPNDAKEEYANDNKNMSNPNGSYKEHKDVQVVKFYTQNEKENNQQNIQHNNKENRSLSPSKEINEKESEKNEDDTKTSKLGRLHFRLRYNFERNALIVTIVKCMDLPAKDPNIGSSDPYVKLQLLPEKQHKAKTRVLRKSRNPVYDEDFTFYGINYNQLQGIALHFVVLSFDRYSRDDVIGEVVHPLTSVDLANSDRHVSLCKEISPRNLKIRTQGRGELLVSLCYQPAANRLTVVVLKARNLPKMDVTGLSDPYVKIYMLYNEQRIAKKKTHVKTRTLNPVFNESFIFDVPCNEVLAEISLEFIVLDWDRVTKNEVIGRLDLGADIPYGSGQHHWKEVCNSPRRQIAEWHKLRE